MSRQRTIDILFLTLIGLGLLDLTPAQVTNEEIRGTIQSLIYSYNQLDNKLERHEHRERALGELMKKAMQSLQKGQKSLEPLNGIFGRLDERVSQIETMLITQEEKYNTQAEKFSQTLEHMFKWMRENDECFRRPPSSGDTVSHAALTPPAGAGSADLLAEIQKLSANVAKLLDNSKDMMEQSEVAFKSMPSTAEMLTKIEDKLVSYSVAAPVTVAPADHSDFEQKVLNNFGELSKRLAALNTKPKSSEGLSGIDKEFIHGLTNETLNALTAYKVEVLSATEKALNKATEQVQRSETNLEGNLKFVAEDITNSSKLLDKFYKETNDSYTKFNEGLVVLDKFNSIMITNSENVLDTQRKVEFGTLQIVQKISQLLEQRDAELRTFLKARFDNVDEGILNTSLEGNKNLSSLLDTELSQVWRRIQIMTGEISDATELLKLMQEGHSGFVNSSFSTMNSLASKVEETKNRMLDMDSNLNYLLGKLSLMSSEFANIKTGLAESLEELRNSFHMLQVRMPSSGDDTQNAEKDKYFTDLNLLSKRQTEAA